MKSIKPLLPSLREKKRYLAFEVISQRQHDAVSVSSALIRAVGTFIGELGMAGAGVLFVNNKYKNKKGILRVSHRYVDHVRASFTFIRSLDGVPVLVRSLGTSGILKKAHSKYLV